MQVETNHWLTKTGQGIRRMSKDEIRRRINDKQSALASRCGIVSEGKECGHIFVVNRKLMDNNKPRTDPRLVHLNDFHHIPDIRLGDKFETIELLGEYTGQKTVFFDELYLTQEQVDKLTKKLSDWLHLDTNT
jgi:hypothetical protein